MTAEAAASSTRSGRLVATLTVAGILSGLVLVGVYETTLPRIVANQTEALRRAVFEVVPGAASMRRLGATETGLRPLVEDDEEGEAIFGAYDADGRFLGYAIPGDGPGFQDTIRLIFGYDPKRRLVVGMRVLESRETPGLGDKIFKDVEFVESFRELSVDPEIVVTKRGASRAPNELDGITGATISSKAVAKIVSSTSRRWIPRLPEPGTEPGPGEGS
jgi:electron transport complex protein RnfG